MRRALCGLLAASLLGAALPALAKDKKDGEHGKRWEKRLELDDGQKEKLKAAKEARRKAVEPLMDEARKERRKLRELVRDEKAADKDIEASLKRLRELRQSLHAEQMKFMDQAASILTPRQRAKLLLAGRMDGKDGGHGRRHKRD